MTLTTFFAALSIRLMLTLGHFLWQGLAAGLAAGLMLVVLRNASAQARYGVLVVVLAMMVCFPLVTFCVLDVPSASSRTLQRAADVPVAAYTPLPTEWNEYGPETLQKDAVELAGSARFPEHESTASLPLAPGGRVFDWHRLAPVAVAAYLAGVALLLGRLMIGLYGGRRVCRRSEPVADRMMLELLARQIRSLGLQFTPAVAWCRQVAVPVVVGVVRPTILLPLSFATGLEPGQVAAILTHELAHIRRYDHVVDLVQRLIEALLFFHPAVWWLSRRIRIEREHCCDDLVVSLGSTPLHYAESLLQVAELSRLQRGVEPIPGIIGLYAMTRPSRLRQRVARLLGDPVSLQLRLGPGWILSVALLTAMFCVPRMLYPEGKSELNQASADEATSDASFGAEQSERILVAAFLEPPRADDEHPNSSIVAVDPETGDWERVVEKAWTARASPDGRSVAYVQADDVLVRDSHGQSSKILDFLAWPRGSHDGSYWICDRRLPSDGGWKSETWRVNADGTGRQRLPIPDRFKVEDVSLNGEWLVATVSRANDSGTYLIRSDGGDKRIIGETKGWNVAARFSPDGQRVLYTNLDLDEKRSIHETLCIVDMQTKKLTRVIGDPNLSVRGCWSPDGNRLALVMWDWERNPAGEVSRPINHRIEIADSDGGNRRRLNTPELTFWLNSEPDWRPVVSQRGDGSLNRRVSADRSIGPTRPDPQPQTELPPVTDRVDDGWGEEKDGLRVRLVLLTEKPAVGQALKLRLEMKNFGDTVRRYDPQFAQPFRVVRITRADGQADDYIGPAYQTAGSPQPIEPGETKVLWDNFDAAARFLLDEPGRYTVATAGARYSFRGLPGRPDEKVSDIPASNPLTIELAPGAQSEPKPTLIRLRKIAPEGWRVSLHDRVLFLTHSPTGLKQDVTTIQLWFDEKEHPPGYSLGEGENEVAVERLGKTKLGFAYLTATARASELWPDYRQRIQAKLSDAGSGAQFHDTELHVVGCYGSGPTFDRKRVDVEVRPTEKPIVLALTAYHSVTWHVKLAEGARVRSVVVGGYFEQKAEGIPEDVPVTVRTYFPVPAPGLKGDREAYFWAYEPNTNEYSRTVTKLEEITGLEPRSFQGSYLGTTFLVDGVRGRLAESPSRPPRAPARDPAADAARQKEDPLSDVADVPALDRLVGDDKMKRYFLIGAFDADKAPADGFGLLVVLPGGDGSAEFNPFIRRIHKNVLDQTWLTVQLVAPKWDDAQFNQVVWPTAGLKYPAAKFTTEELIDAVVADVQGTVKVDTKRVFLLGWSSGGPPCYAAALRQDSRVSGAFVAMSVFKPNQLPSLDNARNKVFYLLQSPEDRVTPIRFAETAERALSGAGATVQLQRYNGGHGWRGNVFQMIRDGIRWMEQAAAKTPNGRDNENGANRDEAAEAGGADPARDDGLPAPQPATTTTSFFGVPAPGKRFVFAIDRSGSMSQRDRLGAAKRELLNSLEQLPPGAQFQIIFYNLRPEGMKSGDKTDRLVHATDDNKAIARRFLEQIVPDGGTEHLSALKMALSLKPDVIYFLTDADDLRSRDISEVTDLNIELKARIHAVELGIGVEADRANQIRELARRNGGTYRYINAASLP